jgi:hypothetical protein
MRFCESPPAVRSLSTPAELPVVYLDTRVQPGAEKGVDASIAATAARSRSSMSVGVANPLPPLGRQLSIATKAHRPIG